MTSEWKRIQHICDMDPYLDKDVYVAIDNLHITVHVNPIPMVIEAEGKDSIIGYRLESSNGSYFINDFNLQKTFVMVKPI